MGVIKHVSELFAGYPHLIQGFRMFLPPGYEIEFGSRDNPDSILVSTPTGVTNLGSIQPAPGRGRGPGSWTPGST